MYISVHKCSEHVNFQLLDKYTWGGYLLDAIDTYDDSIQDAIYLFSNYTGPNSKRKILKSASFILTHDPVAKKRIEKITNAEVSAIYS